MGKKSIIIGGAGFTGIALTNRLRSQNYIVYNVVRPGSRHITRLDPEDSGLHVVSCNLKELDNLKNSIFEMIDVMYYLAWTGGYGFEEQADNIGYLNTAVRLASQIGCKRIVITGSQAEYGVVPPSEVIFENRRPAPFTDYGAAKVSACYLSRQYARDLGIEWVWGRIFSLIGKNEPSTRMLPALYLSLSEGRDFTLSSCRQNWDYLDVHDAADALISLAERGRDGEIYNIANGNYRELKEYVEDLRMIIGSKARTIYGEDPSPFVSLQPSVDKIYNDTGWRAKRSFKDSIDDYKYIEQI